MAGFHEYGDEPPYSASLLLLFSFLSSIRSLFSRNAVVFFAYFTTLSVPILQTLNDG
jgi:hypothetical protein